MNSCSIWLIQPVVTHKLDFAEFQILWGLICNEADWAGKILEWGLFGAQHLWWEVEKEVCLHLWCHWILSTILWHPLLEFDFPLDFENTILCHPSSFLLHYLRKFRHVCSRKLTSTCFCVESGGSGIKNTLLSPFWTMYWFNLPLWAASLSNCPK